MKTIQKIDVALLAIKRKAKHPKTEALLAQARTALHAAMANELFVTKLYEVRYMTSRHTWLL